MRNVSKIIDITGGLAALRSRSIRLQVPDFIRLVIEHVGRGRRREIICPSSAGPA
jgi:hypothetical protein